MIDTRCSTLLFRFTVTERSDRSVVGYRFGMKRILPLVVAAALIVVAVVKGRETDPLPEAPDGTWELDGDSPA